MLEHTKRTFPVWKEALHAACIAYNEYSTVMWSRVIPHVCLIKKKKKSNNIFHSSAMEKKLESILDFFKVGYWCTRQCVSLKLGTLIKIALHKSFRTVFIFSPLSPHAHPRHCTAPVLTQHCDKDLEQHLFLPDSSLSFFPLFRMHNMESQKTLLPTIQGNDKI